MCRDGVRLLADVNGYIPRSLDVDDEVPDENLPQSAEAPESQNPNEIEQVCSYLTSLIRRFLPILVDFRISRRAAFHAPRFPSRRKPYLRPCELHEGGAQLSTFTGTQLRQEDSAIPSHKLYPVTKEVLPPVLPSVPV